MGAPGQASNLSYIGVALDKYKSLLTTSVSAAATSIVVSDTTSWPASGFITIYDPSSAGTLTETVAYSAIAGTTITCSALANAHTAGVLVVVTAAADAPSMFIPVKPPEPFDNLTLLKDTGYRGSEVVNYGTVPGVIHGEYGASGDVFPESFGFWLGALLGDYTSSGGSAPYTHTFAIKNSAGNYGGGQPETLTVTDYQSGLAGSNTARAYPGHVVSELTITFNSEGLLTYTVKLTGWPSGIVTKPTASWTSTTTPIPVWTGVVTLGGSAVQYTESGEISIKRDVKVQHTTDGAQGPYNVWLGPVEVTGKLTFIAADETEVRRYLNVTIPSVDINFTEGTGSALVQVKLHMSKCVYKNTKLGRGGTYLTVETDLEADANTSDAGASGGYSPIKVTLQSATPTGTYQ